MIFTKADRERAERIDKNLIGLICSLNTGAIENRKEVDGLVNQSTARFKETISRLDELRSDVNRLLAQEDTSYAADRVIANVNTSTSRVLQNISLHAPLSGKENGLKKRVLKRKSGR